ncbi:MAG: lipopolysaccharide heptosyltransferase I [Candidatus Aminicenantes bacterium]|nr:lipopolysaccharide heptosyltransferase I [Candidatus Aminicenantes bacterium]
MDNILIIRLSSLGDIIHTLPAFSALREKIPEAKIVWIVEENGREILDLVPGIDRIVVAKTRGWKVTSLKSWSEVKLIRKNIRNRDQTAIDFQGLVKSGVVSYLSRAKRRIGFHRKNLKEPITSIFYTDQLKEISEQTHVILKNLSLLSLVGIEEEQFNFPLMIPDALQRTTLKMLEELGYKDSEKLVILNVGAAWATKRWDPERWVELIRLLKTNRNDLFFLLLWGNEEEKTIADFIHKETSISKVPFLSIKDIIALIKETDLIVSGDTFALQVACALSRPVVGIFGPTNPKRNGPFSLNDRIAFHELECSHCYQRKCSTVECLKKITAEEVGGLCLEVLEGCAKRF